ncbi:MAG: CPBP family intramembrane metalloprotease [Treponema sp.]|jgi:membrane protease YdiL (CAAX protease family)|nr:CPBP family intramembrane metalloprotease [Treponema sp.]
MPGMSKGEAALIEPLILYLVLFLPGAVSYSPPPDLTVFSAERELIRILVYNIPSFTLIWYLLLQKTSLKEWGIGMPGKKDFLTALCAFPGLLLIGLTISVVSPFFTDLPAGAGLTAPGSLAGWIVMILSCLTTGYLEESFFRFYLLTRLRDAGIRTGKLVCLSVLLFALCHVYEGPWGALNAVLAGTLLAFLFLHFKSLHGVALAHGLYNAFVYALGV